MAVFRVTLSVFYATMSTAEEIKMLRAAGVRDYCIKEENSEPMSDYTQHIEDHYWGYLSRVRRDTRNQLQEISVQDADISIPEALERFRIDYTCSARRFLMNWFQNHAASRISAMGQYTYSHHGSVYMFSMISNETVEKLDAEERDAYIRLICEIAAENCKDSPKDWRPLVRKAMLWNQRPELLSKEEAFKLGHGLGFTLSEMNDFLLRVLDNEDLSYTASEDVIEAFCFLYPPANNWKTSEELKQTYHRLADQIPKQAVESKPDGFTRMIEMSLQSHISKWTESGQSVPDQFMDWMVRRAAYMDLPSRSAADVYQRLTLLAYRLTENTLDIQDESTLNEVVIEQCTDKTPFELSAETVYRMTEQILSTAALEFDNARKRQPSSIWRYLTVDQTGKTTARAIGERIPQLLLGQEIVSKADMLFMLWYVCDLVWLENGQTGQQIYDRITDFWTMAETLLELAHLPGFYAPHMLERSFLKAICTMDTVTEYPFEVYEGMCEFVLPEKQQRNRQKQGVRSIKSRAVMEKEVLEAYAGDEIDLEGLAGPMAEHLLANGAVKLKYSFSKDGISCPPNPAIQIHYPQEKTGLRFDESSSDYAAQEVMEERFHFVFGLSLYLTDAAEQAGITCDFRTNYQKNAALTVIRWDQ